MTRSQSAYGPDWSRRGGAWATWSDEKFAEEYMAALKAGRKLPPWALSRANELVCRANRPKRRAGSPSRYEARIRNSLATQAKQKLLLADLEKQLADGRDVHYERDRLLWIMSKTTAAIERNKAQLRAILNP